MQRVHDVGLIHMDLCGITSAHAESTAHAVWSLHDDWDHLCACREYRIATHSERLTIGSPLRMQRVLIGAESWGPKLGITSAHAESTIMTATTIVFGKDHLCACREYVKKNGGVSTRKGSPLRMQRVLSLSQLQHSIAQDHLCACREYLVSISGVQVSAGSPLRMQRVHDGVHLKTKRNRITSAHAESTQIEREHLTKARDHLCACREYNGQLTVVLNQMGSPLRMQRVQ